MRLCGAYRVAFFTEIDCGIERAASAAAPRTPASAVGSGRPGHPKAEVHQEPQPACSINPAAAVARPDRGSLQAPSRLLYVAGLTHGVTPAKPGN